MTTFVRLFPVWVTLGGVVALIHPPAFTWFLDYGLITPGLQIIMLGMGLTLELADFSRVFRAPRIAATINTIIKTAAAGAIGRSFSVSLGR